MRRRVVTAGHLPGSGERLVEVKGRLEFERAQSSLVGRAKLVEGVEQGIARRLAEPAVAGGVQQAMDLEDLVYVVLRAVAIGDLVHAVGDQRRTDPARGTEAATLMREEVSEVARYLEHVAVRTKNHERARRRDILKGNTSRELVRCQTASGRAADLHRLGMTSATVVEHLRY